MMMNFIGEFLSKRSFILVLSIGKETDFNNFSFFVLLQICFQRFNFNNPYIESKDKIKNQNKKNIFFSIDSSLCGILLNIRNFIMRKLTSNGQKVKSSYKGKEQNRDNSPALLYSFNHSQLATHNRSPNPKLHQKYMEDSPPECYSRTNDYAVEQRRKSINSNEILEPFLTNLQKRKKQPITPYHPQESRTAYNAYPEVDDDENRNSYSRISEHYKQIQYILQEENTNLKQHNEYLIRVIGKLQEKQRSSQYKMQEYKHRIFQLEKDRELYQVQRKQLEAHIERIEALVEKEDERRTSDPNQFSPLLTGEKIGYDLVPNRQQNGQTIDSLNDQCQALLYQYKKTGNPELRKECIKKLKQIRTKKIKKNNQPMAKGIQHSYQQGKEFHRNNYQQYRK